ncbi:MAG: hypothetical protein EAX87_00575 [Candidatus Thorarchaeota archaeon]|nr:hypothetical protein [Candidatus Thorarchaeota archaeon]
MLCPFPRDACVFSVVLSGERTRFADCSYKRTAALDVLFLIGGKTRMSGSISRKRKTKAIRQHSKDEVRWYLKYFAEMIKEQHENSMFPDAEYTTLTSKQILRIIEGPSIRRK